MPRRQNEFDKMFEGVGHYWDKLWGNQTDEQENRDLEREKSRTTGQSPAKDWSGFKDLNPDDIIGMSDTEKLHLARRLSGDYGMTMEDMHKYMPSFDERGFRNIGIETRQMQREGAADIAGIGMKQQDNLLDMALKQESSRAKSGFAVTGNPMIDKQRENIYKDIDVTSGRRYDTLLDDVWAQREKGYDLKEDYQEDLGLRIIDYEKGLEDEEDDEDGSTWYKPWTWGD